MEGLLLVTVLLLVGLSGLAYVWLSGRPGSLDRVDAHLRELQEPDEDGVSLASRMAQRYTHSNVTAATVEAASIVVWRFLPDSGVITYSQGGGLVYWGYEPGQTVGQSVYTDHDNAEIYRWVVAKLRVMDAFVVEAPSDGGLIARTVYHAERHADGSLAMVMGITVPVSVPTFIYQDVLGDSHVS